MRNWCNVCKKLRRIYTEVFSRSKNISTPSDVTPCVCMCVETNNCNSIFEGNPASSHFTTYFSPLKELKQFPRYLL